MKRDFGDWMTRLLRGGVRLSAAEHHVLVELVTRLEPDIRAVVESQFAEYNLVQRESGGRALNFYIFRPGSNQPAPVSTQLAMEVEEAPLIRLSFTLAGSPTEHHAVLTAVRGRAFCVTFSSPMPQQGSVHGISVMSTSQSWRSEVRA